MDLSTREGRREQGRLIQQAAADAGISIENLARQIGCSRALIYQYVSGSTLAQPDKLQRIAATLGVPLSHFYGGAEAGTEAAPPPARPVVNEETIRRTLNEHLQLIEAYSQPPDMDRLTAVCERTLPLARQLGDADIEARTLMRLGEARIAMGHHADAEAPFQEALQLLDAGGSDDMVVACRQGLAAALVGAGKLDAARAQFAAVANDSQWQRAWKGRLSLGALCEWAGVYREAMDHLDAVDETVSAHADDPEAAAALPYLIANRVNVYLGCGDYATALSLAEDCFARAEAAGNRDQYIESQLNIGFCLMQTGRWTEAAQWLHRAEAVARLVGDKDRELAASACRAELLAAAGDYAQAIPLARHSLESALQHGTARLQVLAHRSAGTVYLRSGAIDEALWQLDRGRECANGVGMCGAADWLTALHCEARGLNGDTELVPCLQELVQRAVDSGAEHTEALACLVLSAATSDRALAERALEFSARAGIPDLEIAACHQLALITAQEHGDSETESFFARGAKALAALRTQFEDGAMEDHALEDVRRMQLLADYARWLMAAGRKEEAERIIASADWPPLASALEGPPA